MLEFVPSAASEMVVGGWWGFAEADRLLLAVLVIVLAGTAGVYTFMRLLRTRRERRAGGATSARRT